MIERKFVAENLKEFQIEEHLRSILGKAGLSYIKMQRTPLGEKILICSSRPGLIVGKSGSNIIRLTRELKEKFHLENPQIELVEEESPFSNASIVAESIANSLERFGTNRFKGIGHKALTDVMGAGARGVEVLVSGKVPSSRAKTWRFWMGYLKKSGDIAVSGVETAYTVAKLKTGIVGIQVRIMPSTIRMPDDVVYLQGPQLEDVSTGKSEKFEGEASPESKETDAKQDAKKPKRAKKSETVSGDKKPRPRKKAESRVGLKSKEEKSVDVKSDDAKSD